MPVKAFSRRVVVGADEGCQAGWWKVCQIGFTGNGAAHSSDGVFDAAFLPGCIGVAEEGGDGNAVQLVMAGELGAVVESDRPAQFGRQRLKQAGDDIGDRRGGFSFW